MSENLVLARQGVEGVLNASAGASSLYRVGHGVCMELLSRFSGYTIWIEGKIVLFNLSDDVNDSVGFSHKFTPARSSGF